MNLLASVDKLTTMMKNVVHLEETAKITKEEASTAGQNTLSKVEDLRQMLLRAKETNNMVFFNFPLLLFQISYPLFGQFGRAKWEVLHIAAPNLSFTWEMWAREL